MGKKAMWAFCVAAMVGWSAVASAADVAKIEVTVVTGMSSVFDANGGPTLDGQLHWPVGAGGFIYMDNGDEYPFDASTIDAEFSSLVDQSSGGIAKARFNTGTWTLQFRSAGTLVVDLAGTTDWYDEMETDVSKLEGRGVVTPTYVWIHPTWFSGSSADWNSPNGKSGFISLTTGLTPQDPANYQADFTGSSVTLIILADSSLIPEPATLLLLGLGGVAGLLRRKG
jgi:hypothetical protein